MKLHFRYLHSNIEPYKCDYCSYSTRIKCNMKRHIFRIHMKSKTSENQGINSDVHGTQEVVQDKTDDTLENITTSYSLDQISPSIPLEMSVNVSEPQSHSELQPQDEPFKCEICEIVFEAKLILQQHNKIFHFSKNLYRCKECNFFLYGQEQYGTSCGECSLPAYPFQMRGLPICV